MTETPPNDLLAEQAVLASVLLDPDRIPEVIPVLSASDFYRTSHATIYAAVLALFDQGTPVDVITVTAELDRAGQGGSRDDVMDLADSRPTASNVAYYAKIVREKAVLRTVIRECREAIGQAFTGHLDGDELLDFVSAKIDEARSAGSGEVVETRHILPPLVREWETGVVSSPFLDTPLRDLNRLVGGFRLGELVVVAGRPSMGKTTLALNLVDHVAVTRDLPVAVISLETSAKQVVRNLVAARARVNQRSFDQGRPDPEDWVRISAAAAAFDGARISIADVPTATTATIRAMLRRIERKGRLGLVVVDYLQLMDSPKGESRQQEIAAISRGLKAIAREFEVVVVAVSQLSRAVENRSPPVPRLSDLRESGSIEQDADLVLLLYREEYYDENESPGVAEVIVAKNRNGPTGRARVAFIADHQRFADLAWQPGAPGFGI